MLSKGSEGMLFQEILAFCISLYINFGSKMYEKRLKFMVLQYLREKAYMRKFAFQNHDNIWWVNVKNWGAPLNSPGCYLSIVYNIVHASIFRNTV